MNRFIYSILIVLLAASCGPDDIDILKPEIHFKDNGHWEMSIGDTVNLRPKIVYDYDLVYTWKENNVVIAKTKEYTFIPKALKDYKFIFEVSNSRGSDSDTLCIMVREYIDFSKIDNLELKDDVKVLKMHPDNLEDNYFNISDHQFTYEFKNDTTLWGGFAYSSLIPNANTSLSYGCAYTATKPTKSQYMVVSDLYVEPDIIFKDKYIPRSIDVANDECSIYLSKYGSEALEYPEFKKGDQMKVRIYGITDAKTGTCTSNFVECMMINCDFDGPAKYYRLNEWETMDLRSLGLVEGIRIKIVSSVTEYPLLCCIDNLKLQKE